MSSFQKYLPAVALTLLPNVGGFASSLVGKSEPRGEWYGSLKKHSFHPPGWVVGPVWTVLYTCVGVSSYLIFRKGGFVAQSVPLTIYGVQLLLNWSWSPIFFHFHRIDLVKTSYSELQVGVWFP